MKHKPGTQAGSSLQAMKSSMLLHTSNQETCSEEMGAGQGDRLLSDSVCWRLVRLSPREQPDKNGREGAREHGLLTPGSGPRQSPCEDAIVAWERACWQDIVNPERGGKIVVGSSRGRQSRAGNRGRGAGTFVVLRPGQFSFCRVTPIIEGPSASRRQPLLEYFDDHV